MDCSIKVECIICNQIVCCHVVRVEMVCSDVWGRKHWYKVLVPNYFQNPHMCWTPVNKTQGDKKEEDALMGRIFKASVGDLMSNERAPYMNMTFRVEGVRDQECLTNFWGMCLTRDRLCGLVKKWVSLIEADVDVKTTDGYIFRIFCIGFTKRDEKQKPKKAAYATSAKIRAIRKIMNTTVKSTVSKLSVKDLVQELIKEDVSSRIQKLASRVYPMENVFIRKVKILKAPKTDSGQLEDLHKGKIHPTATAGATYGGPDLGAANAAADAEKRAAADAAAAVDTA